MRQGGWAAMVLFLAGGCQGGGSDAARSDATGNPAAALAVSDAGTPEAEEAPSEAASQATVGTGRSVEASNDLYEFAYSYPDAAGALTGLRDMLDARLASERTQLASSARDDRKEAKSGGFPYLSHSFSAKWAVVADLPGWLSLSADVYTFSGGAHGMSNFDSLLWDRRTNTARKPRDLFTSANALRDALQKPFCDALDKERAKRRGEPVQRDSGQMFTECIDPLAQTLILGSANHQTFDRIGILVAPYEAGPYAEGSYEVTLPVTGKVMAALRPQYRASFSAGH